MKNKKSQHKHNITIAMYGCITIQTRFPLLVSMWLPSQCIPMGIGCIIMHPMGIPSHCERYMGWSQLKPVLFKINSAGCSDFMLCVGLSHILIFSTLVCLAQEDFSIIVSSGKVVYVASWFTLLILTFIKTVLIQIFIKSKGHPLVTSMLSSASFATALTTLGILS